MQLVKEYAGQKPYYIESIYFRKNGTPVPCSIIKHFPQVKQVLILYKINEIEKKVVVSDRRLQIKRVRPNLIKEIWFLLKPYLYYIIWKK